MLCAKNFLKKNGSGHAGFRAVLPIGRQLFLILFGRNVGLSLVFGLHFFIGRGLGLLLRRGSFFEALHQLGELDHLTQCSIDVFGRLEVLGHIGIEAHAQAAGVNILVDVLAHLYGTGDTVNDLTPNVGDPNTMVPEYKAFLVNIEKA